MRPRRFSTWRAPGSVSMAAMGATPPSARLVRLSQRLARAPSPGFRGPGPTTAPCDRAGLIRSGQGVRGGGAAGCAAKDRGHPASSFSVSPEEPASVLPRRRAEILRESPPADRDRWRALVPERAFRPVPAAQLEVRLPFVIYCSDKWRSKTSSEYFQRLPQRLGGTPNSAPAGRRMPTLTRLRVCYRWTYQRLGCLSTYG